ncbi:NAD(P)H dehydrogenase [Philodulcilactobacillus myokoensis]|uniref:NAD(P)H dehydrogenase n=1 Tax=Philodulcilactobacillus myokoensis TaxID=2929573 RepID=A0A9W6B3P9_9LACO|nr:NAD(P)H-dependent oxidoreductase [Philodulcilactobacillus myokoensis]GLB47520.1 NAD(P)H dehydrogenase [Philodulcilactobacillus myokoensis]
MKRMLIVYCHPYNGSFNHAELLKIESSLTKQNINYHLIDLYHDHFNPVYDQQELKMFHNGGTHDPLVQEYLKRLKQASGIIFITPIWWNSIPGMLKGFVDKVMKEGPSKTHVVTKTGVKGTLTNLKSNYVFTTSTSPTLYYRFMAGNAIKKIFIKQTLKQLGIQNVKWHNLGGITNSTNQKRTNYLNQLEQIKF